jgi:O-antigen ligase
MWLAFFVLVGKPNSGPEVYENTVLLHVLFAVPAVIYAAWLLLARRLPGPTPLDFCALALIVAFALAISTSVNPRVSLEASLLLGMAVLMFYIAHDVSGLSKDAWARSFTFVVACVSLLGVASVILQYQQWLQIVSAINGHLEPQDFVPPTLFRVQGVLDHPSPFAMFLNLALPFVVVRATAGTDFERKLSVIVLFLGASALLLSLTRGAWLGTAAWIVTFALLLMPLRGQPLSLKRLIPGQSRKVGLAIGASILVLVAGGAGFALLELRPDWLFRSTLDDRLEAYGTAVAIFRDHWLTGAGPYTYMLLDDAYASRDSGVILIVHAHNVYLQVLADLGVVGASVVLAGVVLLLRAFHGSWRGGTYADRLYTAAGIAATTGFMVHGLSDAPHSWNSAVVPLGIAVGLALRGANPQFPALPSVATRIPRAAVVAVIPLTLAVWIAFDTAHSHYDRSLTALEAGNIDVAVKEAVQAASADSGLYAYSLHAGVLSVRQYQQAVESGEPNLALLDEGITLLRRATELDSNSSLGYANLALALMLRGDVDGAVQAARLAIKDNPGSDDIHAAIGTVFEWAGLFDEAAKAYAGALALDPTLTQAPFWATTPGRMQLRTEAMHFADLNSCEVGRSAVLYAVYKDDLKELASACALLAETSGLPADRANHALILGTLGSEEAETEAAEAMHMGPGDRDVLLARALLLTTDIADVRLLLTKAMLLWNYDAGPLLLSTYEPEAGSEYAISEWVPRRAQEMPKPIAALLPARQEPSAPAPGAEASGRTRIYYSWSAHREAPPVTMIPGDWTAMVSPRALLLREIAEISER